MPYHKIMRLNKSLLIFLLVLTIACKKKTTHVYLYTEDGVEMLNGNVREVFIGDSESADGFYKANFDGKGNMDSSIEKVTGISQTREIKDTSINLTRTSYTFIYGPNGIIKSVVGNLLTDTFKTTVKWGFDKSGHLTTYNYSVVNFMSAINYYKCDTSGNVIERKFIQRGVALEPDLYKYKFDNKHRLVEYTLSEGGLLVRSNSYHYTNFDSHKNWIKRSVKWESGFPMHRDSGIYLETRKITYY